MSYAYQEIFQEGHQAGARRILADQLAFRFPKHDLDALLSACTADDLAWLGRELIAAPDLATVRRDLAARLGRRE